MKVFDFEVVCPKCRATLDVPLSINDEAVIFNGANFRVDCNECKSEFKVTIKLSTEAVNNVLLH